MILKLHINKDIAMSTPIIDKEQIKTNHKNAAVHHQKAAEYHVEAAKHHETGDHEKGNSAANLAHGHTAHAVENASQASKQSAGIQPNHPKEATTPNKK